jgi:hypothetical protein
MKAAPALDRIDLEVNVAPWGFQALMLVVRSAGGGALH